MLGRGSWYKIARAVGVVCPHKQRRAADASICSESNQISRKFSRKI